MEQPKFLTLKQIEKDHILMVLEATKGNKSQAAKCLDITVKTLYNKLTEYGIHLAKKRQPTEK
jgi:two-component system, NtrC family, response regulator